MHPPESVILTKQSTLRTGHTRPTQGYLLVVGEEAPYCEVGIAPLTVVSILTECPEYSKQRTQYFGSVSDVDPIDVFHVLRDDNTAMQKVLQYIRLTGSNLDYQSFISFLTMALPHQLAQEMLKCLCYKQGESQNFT